jgi:prolyl-tRNA editing enzyme YbaK/EbsC (Cys-tRNA(Pro) deacylase)
VDRRVIAARYGVSRRKVELADAETVLAVTGYQIGAVPPLGHRKPLPALMDQRVLDQTQVYGGGGEGNALVRLDPADIQKHIQAEVMDLHTPPKKKD